MDQRMPVGEKLSIVENTAVALLTKNKIDQIVSKGQTDVAVSDPAIDGGKFFHRAKLNFSPLLEKSTETPSTDPTTADSQAVDVTATPNTTETIQAYQTRMELMYDLLSQISYNLSLAEQQTLDALNLTVGQQNAELTLAEQNQINLNDQLAEQAKRQQHMKWLNWGLKGVMVGIIIATTVGTGGVGGVIAAPISTMLMVSLLSVMTVRPQLINQIAEPISKGLVAAGVPDNLADMMAGLIVTAALVAATAGAGALADSAVGGQRLAESLGGQALESYEQKFASGALDYKVLAKGNAGIATAALLSVTQPFTPMFEAMFPNNPMAAQIAGIAFTLTFALASGAYGGYSLNSSGYMKASVSELQAQYLTKMLTAGMGLVQSAGEGAQAWMIIEEGDTEKEIGQIQGDMTLNNAAIQGSQSLNQTTQQWIQLIAETLASLTKGIRSLALPGAATSANNT